MQNQITQVIYVFIAILLLPSCLLLGEEEQQQQQEVESTLEALRAPVNTFEDVKDNIVLHSINENGREIYRHISWEEFNSHSHVTIEDFNWLFMYEIQATTMVNTFVTLTRNEDGSVEEAYLYICTDVHYPLLELKEESFTGARLYNDQNQYSIVDRLFAPKVKMNSYLTKTVCTNGIYYEKLLHIDAMHSVEYFFGTSNSGSRYLYNIEQQTIQDMSDFLFYNDPYIQELTQ